MSGDEGGRRTWDNASLEAAAGAAGGLVGAFLGGGPGGALVGGAVPPYVLAAFDDFIGRWGKRRRESAGRLLLTAAEEMGTDVDGVLAVAEARADTELLTGQALAAGAATANEKKIEALARVLARALTAEDDAKLDESAAILEALTQMETPHMKVLGAFAWERLPLVGAEEDPWYGAEMRWRALSLRDLREEFEAYGVALNGVISTLERAGLVARVGIKMDKMFEEMKRHGDRPFAPHAVQQASTTRWRLTPLGFTVYKVVEEVAPRSAEGG